MLDRFFYDFVARQWTEETAVGLSLVQTVERFLWPLADPNLGKGSECCGLQSLVAVVASYPLQAAAKTYAVEEKKQRYWSPSREDKHLANLRQKHLRFLVLMKRWMKGCPVLLVADAGTVLMDDLVVVKIVTCNMKRPRAADA